MGFHPTTDKPLIFAGDKMGNLGMFDASQVVPKVDEDDEDAIIPDPEISMLKLHSRTISDFKFNMADHNSVYTASYDSSIRRLDLAKGVAVEVWAPSDKADDQPLSGLALPSSDPNLLYFATLNGTFGIHDMRTGTSGPSVEELVLSEKKIGGFSVHPVHSHILATASLDRSLKIWDLRKINGKDEWRLPALVGEHYSRLSVSHAAFNAAGQVATSSYDDTIKIYDFNDCGSWKSGAALDENRMEPSATVRHNNQTGRWVTMYMPFYEDTLCKINANLLL
jgi:WD repeat-containing protein 76